ncbi:MAG: hypothetical protein SGJ27_09310 [Candidatus Melainabacteria bacterium]|nr:hypothetical protein [Candidatus Melainabacteria bacterium]
MVGLGTVAAKESATTILATTAGRTLIREGQEQVLERGLTAAVNNALANGASHVDQAVLRQVVSSVAASGQEETLMAVVTTTLNRSIERTANKALIEVAMNATANGTGNATVTFGDGILHGKSVKQAGSEALVSGSIGVVAGAGFTAVIKGGSAAYRTVRGSGAVDVPAVAVTGGASEARPALAAANGTDGPLVRTDAPVRTDAGTPSASTGAQGGTRRDAPAAVTGAPTGTRSDAPAVTEGPIGTRSDAPATGTDDPSPRIDAQSNEQPASVNRSDARDGSSPRLDTSGEPPAVRDTSAPSTSQTPETWDGRSNPQPLSPQEIAQWKQQIDELRASNDADKIALARRAEKRVQESEAWHKTAADFPERTPEELVASRRLLEGDLSNVRASGSGSVLDRLNDANLSPAQRERVLGVLSEVREHYTGVRNGKGVMDVEQEVNWIHTQGELGRVLDAGKAANLSPKDMEKALLASMLSDADKHGRNFFTHHLDGARAAETVMERYKGDGFTTADVADVVQAIKEHQVGPPGFMAMLYGGRIKGLINEDGANTLKALEARPAGTLSDAEAKQLADLQNAKRGFDERQAQADALSLKESELAKTGGKLSQEELDLRSKLRGQNANGAFVTQADLDNLKTLHAKMSDPHNSALEATADGRGMQLQLSDQERQLLQRSGNDNWFVPSDNSSIRSISDTLIAGDSIDNYFTPGGYSKIVKIRGPETGPFFQDKTVDVSISSVRDSGRDVYGGSRPGTPLEGSDPYGILPGGSGELGRKPFGVMNDESRAIARAAASETEQAVGRAKQEVEQWLRTELNVAPGSPIPEIPYWNSDLKYPVRSELENRDWWRINATPEAMRSPADAKFWADQRYSGLNPEQIKQYEFAKEIRARMVEALRAQQRFSTTPSSFPTASSQVPQ